MNANQSAVVHYGFPCNRVDEVEAERRARALRAQVISGLLHSAWQRAVARFRRSGTATANRDRAVRA